MAAGGGGGAKGKSKGGGVRGGGGASTGRAAGPTGSNAGGPSAGDKTKDPRSAAYSGTGQTPTAEQSRQTLDARRGFKPGTVKPGQVASYSSMSPGQLTSALSMGVTGAMSVPSAIASVASAVKDPFGRNTTGVGLDEAGGFSPGSYTGGAYVGGRGSEAEHDGKGSIRGGKSEGTGRAAAAALAEEQRRRRAQREAAQQTALGSVFDQLGANVQRI